MILDIKEDNKTIQLSYENNTEYVPLRDKVEEEYYNQFEDTLPIFKEYVDNPSLAYEKYDKPMIRIAHKKYYNCFEYSLTEIINNLKKIVKKYGDYYISEYAFCGVFLTNDDNDLNWCEFSTEEEICFMDFKLTAEPLTSFIEFLSQQTMMGSIKVKRIKCELNKEGGVVCA